MPKEIKLTRGKVAIVDEEDFDRVNAIKWYAYETHGSWYAARKTNDRIRKMLLMHRFIMNPPRDKLIDHINWNGLDNRRTNLRICTHKENRNNTRPK